MRSFSRTTDAAALAHGAATPGRPAAGAIGPRAGQVGGGPIGTAARAALLADELRHRRPTSPRGLLPAAFEAPTEAELAEASLSLARRIRAHLERGTVEVTLTDNRYTMISVRRERERGPRYFVRLHHMFAAADPAVTRALAQYVARNDSDASRVLGDFIDANQARVRPLRRTSQPVIEPHGRFFDLQQLYDDLNRRYFGGAITARITWGQKPGRPRRRNSIKMGSYSVEERLIRMHRSLDRSFVPRFFVEWIIFHEMLHQVHEATTVNGRRQFHTRAFLEDEARFEHFERARQWERDHIDALLTY